MLIKYKILFLTAEPTEEELNNFADEALKLSLVYSWFDGVEFIILF
jgi:hypothetical protein